MKHNEVREKYINFLKKDPRNHKEIPSATIVPQNDPTTLFVGSGMQPLIPYLLGETHPLGKRLVNSQKCFRAQDIEEVGDNRHTTFFEMLGNWSLGDYFKTEQLSWFFGFLTQVLKLDPTKLYVTIFEGSTIVPRDTESQLIWQQEFLTVSKDFHNIGINEVTINNTPEKGMQKSDRIFYYGVNKNWWSRSGIPDNMPPGEPGGPDSEVFFDFGVERKFHENSPWNKKPCHPNCDCGRFLEIGNSVFMEFQKQAVGVIELPQKNVDFGGGLERLIAATMNEPDIFNIDLYKPLITEIEKETNQLYVAEEIKHSIRIIADHIKAATFLIADGVAPTNKAQGYVLRRLLRRAAVKMHLLRGGLTPIESFSSISAIVLKMYDGIYFDEAKLKEKVSNIIEAEMYKFSKSLDKGLKILENEKKLTGKTAFDLYQTYGFPIELTKEILRSKGKQIDEEQFKKEFEKHKELSRTTSAGMFKGGLADQSQQVVRLHTATHLLQQALREVLGNHVRQKGSHITAERLRFDFTYDKKLSNEEVEKVEKVVNEQIGKDLKVDMNIMPFKEATSKGALFVENEKYPEQVKVYAIGNFSKEVCGGPHVDSTKTLGSFKIIKEESLGTGIRRIYAVVSSS